VCPVPSGKDSEGSHGLSKQPLGHASIQITADLYGHLFRETSVVVMRRLEHYMLQGKGLLDASDAEETDGRSVRAAVR
jgi:hypothetical protein